MRKILYIFLLFISLANVVWAYDPPTLQCLQLNNGTTLHVTWSNTDDCSHFVEYQFFVNGAYVETFVAGSGYTLCNYGGRDIHVTEANTYSCYIKAKDEDGNLWTSNTLQMPAIHVEPSADSAYALISWDAPSSGPLDDTWGDSYFIYKKYYFEDQFSNLPFATVPNTVNNYTDTSDVCYRDISYSVGITNTYPISETATNNCIFRTSIGTVTLVDRTQPNIPVLDSVSFDESNRVALGFHATDPMMYGFIAYFQGDGWISIDTVYNATYWIDPNGGERCYRIAVLDSCVNSSQMVADEQCGLHLYQGTINACEKSASVNWSTYPNLTGGVGSFEIFLSADHGTSYESIATVNANTHSFTIENLENETDYRVFVRVHNADGTITASSNRIDFTMEASASDDITHIRSVSVIDNDHIQIVVHTSGDTLPFNSITLQRSENGTDFTTLQTLPYQNDSEYEFQDNTADFSKKVYYYQTFVENSCHTNSGYSKVAHSIFLQGEATSAQENVLNWNNYGQSAADVEHYRVMRKQESDIEFIVLPGEVTPYAYNAYHDDVSSLFEGGSKFKYYVVAQPVEDEYGFSDMSNSNVVDLQQMPNTYVPNAFSPRLAINNVFMPVNTFVSSENYFFAIYARTGDMIFMTRNPNEGWDGTIKGRRAPFDVYVYKITYTLPDRSLYEKTGTVTLVP